MMNLVLGDRYSDHQHKSEVYYFIHKRKYAKFQGKYPLVKHFVGRNFSSSLSRLTISSVYQIDWP